MASSPILLAMGNPLLDMQVRNGEKLLEKYGLKSNDAILAEEKHMPIYAEVAAMSPVYVAGGAAQNAARCAQYILPAGSTVYLGSVGKDDLADQLRAANKKEGLKELYQVVDGQPTGACAVVITGHDRSLCTQLGAAEKFAPSHLKTPEVSKAIQDAKFYYVGGFFLTHGIESTLELAEISVKENKVFTLNLSAPFIAQFFKDNVDKVMPYVDYLFGNESEAEAFAQAHNWDTTDLTVIATRIASLPKKLPSRPRVVIITQGAKSTIVASSSVSPFPSTAPIQKNDSGHYFIVAVSPLSDDQIVDTNGAGDAFAGGVLGALGLNKPLDSCIEIGHKLGQMCVGQVGPQLKWPKVEVV
ncbi:Ribokinase-like protein [Melampsora americana]|nr:Ribokinase-like protein [Melampsora americana]